MKIYGDIFRIGGDNYSCCFGSICILLHLLVSLMHKVHMKFFCKRHQLLLSLPFISLQKTSITSRTVNGAGDAGFRSQLGLYLTLYHSIIYIEHHQKVQVHSNHLDSLSNCSQASLWQLFHLWALTQQNRGRDTWGGVSFVCNEKNSSTLLRAIQRGGVEGIWWSMEHLSSALTKSDKFRGLT